MLVPKLRFPEFTDPWEQRKVSDLFKITRGYVLAATLTQPQKTDITPYPVYSSQTKDKGLMGYYKDFLYEDAITWTTDGANAGTVNYRSGKFYCTNVCGVLLSNKVKANQMIAEALNNVAKGYVSYVGNPKLMNNVMADIVIQIPTQAEEREQLSAFFANLDNLITLLQCELDALKKLKKAAMQKFFSQEVRFKRENGTDYPEWEEKILQDVSYYITTTGTGVKSVYVSTENMQKGCAGVCFDCNDDIAVKGIQYVPDDILISNIRPYLKKAWKADRKGICSTDVLCIRGTSEISSDFLYTLLSSDSFFEYVVQGVKGTKMPRGDKKHIMEMPIFIPCTEEQQKIADFLSTYDEAISYAKQELEHWKLLKKGLLQQMFV